MKGIVKLSLIVFALSFLACEKKGDQFYYEYDAGESIFDGTIYEYLKNQKGVFDSLLLVLNRMPELENKLVDEKEKSTLFAVTNRSFELSVNALNSNRLLLGREPLYLEDLALNELDSLIYRYLFEGMYDTEVLKPFKEGEVLQSLKHDYDMHLQYEVLDASGYVGGGQQQIRFSDVNNSIFQRYWQRINTTAVNIYTSNGIIHILSPGHDFGFGKFTQKFSQE